MKKYHCLPAYACGHFNIEPVLNFEKMKRIMTIVSVMAFSFLMTTAAVSQTKVGYIDSKKILQSMQESQDAKKSLDDLVSQWQNELKSLQDSLTAMKDDYEKKKLILTDQLKEQSQANITALETTVANFKIQKFGEGGEYFQKQTELMRPVQDRIFKAIEAVAKDEGYDYVFDRSSDILLLYVNESYDLTQKVINQITGK